MTAQKHEGWFVNEVWTIVLGGAARQKTRHKQDKKKDLPSIHLYLL